MEASIVLPIVIVTLLFIANILNICMVHVCMQQALNNTAKKISQDSYLVYKIASEDKYKEFIKNLDEINAEYNEVESAATATKEKFDELEASIHDTIEKVGTLVNTFNKGKDIFEQLISFGNNIKELKDSCKNTQNEFTNFKNKFLNLSDKTTKENISSVVAKLLIDTTTGSISASIVGTLFDKYRENLKIPASKISDLYSLHSSVNEDGSFTMVIDYIYNNPFSFLNDKSHEYSIINKRIRMRNIITVMPFVGKNGTSLQ